MIKRTTTVALKIAFWNFMLTLNAFGVKLIMYDFFRAKVQGPFVTVAEYAAVPRWAHLGARVSSNIDSRLGFTRNLTSIYGRLGVLRHGRRKPVHANGDQLNQMRAFYKRYDVEPTVAFDRTPRLKPIPTAVRKLLGVEYDPHKRYAIAQEHGCVVFTNDDDEVQHA